MRPHTAKYFTCAAYVVLVCLAMEANTLLAATQGRLGASSQGDMRIALTVGGQVRISGLTDIQLSTTEAVTRGGTAVCIYSTAPAGIQLNALGSGSTNAFTLTSGTQDVTYEVIFQQGSSAHPLIPDHPLTETLLGNLDSIDCADREPSANIEVSIAAQNRARLASGHYTGTLTLMIATQ